jgi:hypothetical protein
MADSLDTEMDGSRDRATRAAGLEAKNGLQFERQSSSERLASAFASAAAAPCPTSLLFTTTTRDESKLRATSE